MVAFAKVAALLDQRRPGYSLPQALYNDPDVFAFDLEHIFMRTWLLVGFECELAQPGARLALTVGKSPIVIVRGRDGVIRGFHNTCRHRGAQICAEGHGKGSRLVCPYHQWTFDLDGRLIHAARMPADFDKSQHGLGPIHVETVAGCIYACLAEEAPDFEAFRREAGPMLEACNIKDAKVAATVTLVEKGNWKLVMENARECYHCATGHPELAVTFPVRTKRHFEAEGDPRLTAFNARMQAAGLPVGPAEGEWWQAARFALNPGMTSMTMDGKLGVRKLLIEKEDGDVGSLRWTSEVHSFAHATADMVFYFSSMPTDVNETVVTGKWLVHKDAVEGRDYHVDRLIELWDITNRQDRDLVETNQRGVNSMGYKPGRYSDEAESLVQRFVDWYCHEARNVVTGESRPFVATIHGEAVAGACALPPPLEETVGSAAPMA